MTLTRGAVGFSGLTHIAIALALGGGAVATRSTSADARVVERIEIHGNTRTRDKVIRRALELDEGRRLDRVDLDGARRRVLALGYFMFVAVRVGPGSSTGLARIDIDVTEPPQPRLAGFSSVDNFIAECVIRQQ